MQPQAILGDRLHLRSGPVSPVEVSVHQSPDIGSRSVPAEVTQVQVPARVNLEPIVGVPVVGVGIVDYYGTGPVGTVECLVHQLLSARLVVGQLQVAGPGVPCDVEVTGVLVCNYSRGGYVGQGPRVDQLVGSLVVAEEVKEAVRVFAHAHALVAVTDVRG